MKITRQEDQDVSPPALLRSLEAAAIRGYGADNQCDSDDDGAISRTFKVTNVQHDQQIKQGQLDKYMSQQSPRPELDSFDDQNEISSLSDLVVEIERELAGGTKGSQKDAFIRLLENYDPDMDELEQFIHFDAGKKYTRNLIATDNETFTLMLLCWNEDKFSPIHDHPCDGCWLKVIDGDIVEVRYALQKNDSKEQLVETSRTEVARNGVAYIDDYCGFHKVGTASGRRAMSLHLYCPPFERCRIWLNEKDASSSMYPIITYYSEYGQKIDY